MNVSLRATPEPFGRKPLVDLVYESQKVCSEASGVPIPESSWPLLKGLDVLVLGMLRKRPHPTHFNLDQALEVVARLKPRLAYFIHMTHDLLHAETEKELPEGVHLAYDGLQVELHGFDPTGW